MDPAAPPRPPSLALKIATLLFSGSLAALAIANGGSLGCSPAETPDHPPAPDTTPPPRAIESPAEPDAPETAQATPSAVNAPATPDANENANANEDANTNEDANVNAAPSPPRFLGGSKSDVDVWGVEDEGVGGLGLVGTGRGKGGGGAYIGGSKSGLLHRPPATSKPRAQRADNQRNNRQSNAKP